MRFTARIFLLTDDKSNRLVLNTSYFLSLQGRAMDIKFHGKRALVTGASQGIGRDIAVRLAQCGAAVVALDRSEDGLKTLKDEVPGVELVCVDLTNWQETRKAADKCGPIDLLVNCAGVTKVQPFEEVDEQVVDWILGVNLKGLINLTQVITNGMRARKSGGAIVNISSQASKIALPHHVIYNASKAGVDMVTKCLALDLGPYNIRTNAVNPTVVNTELGRLAWKDPVKKAAMMSRIPLGRFAEIEDIVGVVLFLLSDHAAMINGACLPIDGGVTAC